jgi:hypothetical protein
MIIDNGEVKSKSSNVNYYEDSNFQVYFQGFIYIPYIKSGIESIKKILTAIKNDNICNITDIKGNYFIFIIDKSTDYQYVFVDSSGIFKAFIRKNVVSTSLLELARYLKYDSSKLDFNAIVEFLHFGFTYFDHTFFKNIRKINKNEIIVFAGNSEPIIKEKGLAEIQQPIDSNIIEFFQGFHEAVKDKKISIDLTGGTDSRLIVSLLDYLGADYELAVSGTKGHKDIDLARDISEILEKQFFVSYHKIEDITCDSLKDLFFLTDAQTDILNYHRKYQLIQQRKERGFDLQITGAGGELYKDFWWLQDLPFYRKKNANLEKLYRLRIEPVFFPHHYLGDKTIAISRHLKDQILKQLQGYLLGTNTQTYDNIYYQYKIQAHTGAYVTIGSQIIDTYAPLVELDLVRLGFSLKRRERFFNHFHRKVISTYCPVISKIRTTEGVTCSSKKSDRIKDLARYVLDKQKRLTKQILRKILKKTYLQSTPTDREIYKKVVGLDIFKDQLAILKEYKIIHKDLDIDAIKDNHIGKFLVIGLLLREIQS